ncbi:MAG: OmpH family outer membrane protein [Bacteroidales bacterium]|jgi:outer membrane protein|nr:OmpH family outer membrane protein [Bacteroidales bacterium]
MKNILKITCLALLFAVPTAVNAQKFAHINFEQLVEAMPEKATSLATLQKEYGEVKNLIEEMSVDFNKRVAEAQKTYESLSPSAKQLLEQDLQETQQRIQNFQMNAEQQLTARREELLSPILDKAEAAIKKIAEREGFIYVFDVSKGSQVLYYNPKLSTDVMPLAKKELGIN